MKKTSGKLLCLLLAAAMLLCALPAFASAEVKAKIKADGFNSVRESGMLIIYTPAMGATTGTNEWGCEAVIENDRCIKVGGGNNTIPANGFVVSGHDEAEGGKRMGDWIKNNIKVGDYVYYNTNGEITVSTTPEAVSAYYEVSTRIDGVNITRSENFLVIYNQRGKKTDTNQWGFEAVVTAGVVTSIGGNDNTVPSEPGSFVISGHGTAVDWIQENAKLGMGAEYDAAAKTLKLVYDETAALSGAKAQLEVVKTSFATAKNNYMLIDYNAVEKQIADIESAINAAETAYSANKDGSALAEAVDKINNDIKAAAAMISENRPVEYRAAWLRPNQTSAKEVDAYVERLYNQGINALCIETLWGGTMIMPMPEGSLFEVNPSFKHFDMLQAYIDSCHKRGMELHCWIPIFYVGNAEGQNAFRSPGKKKPEWLSKSNKGGTFRDSDNYMMIDPGNEEACAFLLASYKYILETYDIDGFQLDYIRYWSRTADTDFGYNEGAMKAFEEKYGQKPSYNPRAKWWNDWVNFRAQYVTDFVGRVRRLIDEVAPDVLLGADVVPDPSDGKTSNYQDYFKWMDNDWLDIVFPMSYGLGYEKAVLSQTERCGDSAFIAVGLGIFMDELENSHMFDQVSYAREVGADGVTYFEASAYLRKNTGEFLHESVYAEPAITPYLDRAKAAQTQADYAVKRVEEVVVKSGGATAEGGAAITGAINALRESFTDKEMDGALYSAAVKAAEDNTAEKAAAAAIKRDLLLIAKIYNIYNKKADTGDLPDIPEYSVPEASEPVSEPEGGKTSEPAETSGQTEGSGAENAPQGGGKSSPLNAILIAVAAAVAIGAVAFTVFTVKKKKK